MKVLVTAQHTGGAEAIAPVIKSLIVKKEEVVVISHEHSGSIFSKNDILHRAILDCGFKDVSVSSMEALLLKEKPDFVLTGTMDRDNMFEGDVADQTVTFAARKMGIKTLAVLDSHVRVKDRFNRLGERTFEFLPDKIATEQSVISIIKNQGFELRLLEATGNPSFDSLFIVAEKFTEQQKQAIRTKIGFPNVDFLVFYAGTMFRNEYATMGYWDYPVIQIISDMVTKKNVAAVVKLHPRMPQDEQDLISDYVGKCPGRVKLVKDLDGQDLILASDLTTTTQSTLGVKAVHMGRLCLSLQPGSKTDDPFIPSAQGFVPVGYAADKCRQVLGVAITSEEYRTGWLTRASGFKTDGKATERVIGLIYKMLKGEQ